MRLVVASLLALSLLAAPALAEEPSAMERHLGSLLLFWSGAALLMFLVGRVVFREQLHERRTIRMLVNGIGPFFPEFDVDAIRTWVDRAAPHIWSGWRKRDLSSLEGFATPELFAEQDARFAEEARQGLAREARLEKVLKVHPLGLYMVGEGPPPANVELMLRIEEKGVDYHRRPDGSVVGSTDVRQVQHLWTLRHDGRRWWLHHVEPAERDVTDLAKRTPVPPIFAWKRPEGRPPEEE